MAVSNESMLYQANSEAHRFPYKLWRIINDPKSESIQWNKDGDGLVIDSCKFKSEFLDNPSQHLFKTNCLSSVLRQLNLYGFRKTRDRLRGSRQHHHPLSDRSRDPTQPTEPSFEFRHPHFRRYHEKGVEMIQRRPGLVMATKRGKENVGPAAGRKKQAVKVSSVSEDDKSVADLLQSQSISDDFANDEGHSSDMSQDMAKSDEDLCLPEDWNYDSYLKNFAAYELRGPIPGLHYTPGQQDAMLPPSQSNQVRRGRPNLSQQRANRRAAGTSLLTQGIEPATSHQHTFDPNIVPTYLVPAAHQGQAFVVQPWPPTTQYYPVSSYVDHISACVYQPPQPQLHFFDQPEPTYAATSATKDEEIADTVPEENQDGGPQDEYYTLLRQLAAFYNAHPFACPPGVGSPVSAESLQGAPPAAIIGHGDIYAGATCTVDTREIGIFGQ